MSLSLKLSLSFFFSLLRALSLSHLSFCVLNSICQFPWCNNSTMADFKLLTWSQWMWTWNKMCRNGSGELVWAGSSTPLGVNYCIQCQTNESLVWSCRGRRCKCPCKNHDKQKMHSPRLWEERASLVFRTVRKRCIYPGVRTRFLLMQRLDNS